MKRLRFYVTSSFDRNTTFLRLFSDSTSTFESPPKAGQPQDPFSKRWSPALQVARQTQNEHSQYRTTVGQGEKETDWDVVGG